MSTVPPDAQSIRLPEGTLPALERRAAKVKARLEAQSPGLHICSHIPDGAPALACAAHPAAGVMCPDCAIEHTGRHPHHVEHDCDICRAQGDDMRSIFATINATAVTASTDGRRHLLIGPVTVICLGVCLPCGVAAGLQAVEQ
ncbi:hypothetical protein BH23ACT2_BH23ACT2_07310 [soil metagenome]